MGGSVAEVAKACEVNANVLHRWRREIQEFGGKAFASNGQRRVDENRVAELERKVGRQALEIDFLRRCLQHVEEQRKLQALNIRQRPKWRASCILRAGTDGRPVMHRSAGPHVGIRVLEERFAAPSFRTTP